MKEDYKTKCDLCGKEDKNNPTFARIFYRTINEKYMCICERCWSIKVILLTSHEAAKQKIRLKKK